MKTRTLSYGLVLIALAGCSSTPDTRHSASMVAPSNLPPNPPPTRVETVNETLHGTAVSDDFRWLEGDNSDAAAMGKMTPEIAEWTDAQNAYTRAFLDTLPGRERVEAELRPLMEVGSIGAPGMYENRYFYSKREGNQNQPVYYWREGYRGEAKVLLDPAKMDETGLTTVAWVSPSQDGTLCAFGTYRAGDENSTLRVIEVDTGTVRTMEIPGKTGAPNWLPDNSGFTYRNLSDARNPYSGQIKFHAIGEDPTKDKLIFRQYTEAEDKKLATTWGPDGGISEDGKWLTITYATGTSSNDLYVVDFPRWRKTGELFAEHLSVGEDAQSGGEAVGDTYYMQTNLDAPNGKLVAVDLNRAARANWKTIIPERPDSVIRGVSIAKDVIAVNYLRNASSVIELFGMDGSPRGTLRLPGIGSAGLSTDLDRTEAYLSFSSFNYPPTIFRVDLAKPDAKPELWERPSVPVDPETVAVKQVRYSSKDGTPITMFIVHKKGLKLNGDNPTILYGYGGFNQSMTPSFSASLFQWLNAGGVYALPNLRGGGEYGKAWHEAGKMERKQNVFDDFAAAAEWLTANNYTRPERLAISGGSNGGLLTGTLVTQRPELFAAAIVAVPLLDMIRYQDFLMAKYWVPEYGSAGVGDQFAYLMKYSPYQNVRKGVAYPAVYVTAGENDSRVHPMHARKFAAALRAASASDQMEKPILLWVDREAGHGQGKPLNLRIRDAADQRMFLMRQLGMLRD